MYTSFACGSSHQWHELAEGGTLQWVHAGEHMWGGHAYDSNCMTSAICSWLGLHAHSHVWKLCS